MMYYHEYKTFDGRWAPATSPDLPKVKIPECCDNEIRSIILVPDFLEYLTLGQLHTVLSADGEIATMHKKVQP